MIPNYVAKIEFKLNEASFNHCLKEAEKEINLENLMFNKNENINMLIHRNKVIITNCDLLLNDLTKYLNL